MTSRLLRLLQPVLKLPDGPPVMPTDGYSQVRVFRASRRYLAYQYFGFANAALGAIVGIVILYSIGPSIVDKLDHIETVRQLRVWILLVELFVVFQLVLQAITIKLDWDLRYYIVTDKSLRIRQGVFRLEEMTLTYQNIQNVSIEQGPLQRLFGFADVKVRTAGGGGAQSDGQISAHEGILKGVENAPELRDLIRDHLATAHQNAGLGDPEDELEPSLDGPDAAAGASYDALPADASGSQLSGYDALAPHLSLLGEVLEEAREARRALST